MKNLLLWMACLISLSVTAQRRSIMQEQSEYYASLGIMEDKQYDSLNCFTANKSNAVNSASCNLTRRVFGWHPYWSGTSYTAYQWNLLSDLCYFDYTISPSTGSNTNASFAWNTASVVTVAKNNGTKIHICATLFSGHATFWSSASAQNTFINNIISLLNSKQGNGVNIDFEGMGSTDKAPFTNFITNLNNALNAANPSYELSICLYAVDWSGVFDMPVLNTQVDFFTIMGYDYYYSGSATAGPESPLYNFQTSYNYTLPKSITYYIKQGATPAKLLMGLPYYGREWQTASNSIPSATSGTFTSSRTLSYVNNNAATYSQGNKNFDAVSYNPYFTYQSGGNWRQCWIDDIYSMGRKYDLINQRGLGGIGIWALGYDAGMTSYWNLIQEKFSDCASVVCSDSLYDMGGPVRNYYDSEKYEYTISAPTGSLVQLQFKSFGTELNYDSLWLYNGTNTLSPLIGAYTGTNSPGIIISSGQNITLRFKSDGATVSFGFKAFKSCVPQITTSVRMSEGNEIIHVFPNPVNNEITISGNDLYALQIIDVTGRELYNEDIRGISVKKISLQQLEFGNGIYFLRITNAQGIQQLKKIIFERL